MEFLEIAEMMVACGNTICFFVQCHFEQDIVKACKRQTYGFNTVLEADFPQSLLPRENVDAAYFSPLGAQVKHDGAVRLAIILGETIEAANIAAADVA